MSLLKIFFIAAVVLSLGRMAFAQTDDLGVSIAQDNVDTKVKRRNYPGGRDEEDLKVQATLPQPSRDPDVRAAATSAPADEPAHD